MYDNILVPIAPEDPIDASEAIKSAHAMLNSGGKITVFAVIEAPPSYVVQFLPPNQAKEVLASEKERIGSQLGELDASNLKVVQGHAAQAILYEAEESKVDCVVISSHRPGPRHFFLGSTAARVVRRAKCCVHVLR